MNPQDPAKVRITAGRELIKKIDELIQEDRNFVIESTLSGFFLEKYIQQLKENNYEINITYIFLGSADLCIERIKSRVLQGGHDVPDEDVKRRFNRGLNKFWNRYKAIADYYSIYFNNEVYDFKIVAQGKIDNIEILDEQLFKQYQSFLENNRNE